MRYVKSKLLTTTYNDNSNRFLIHRVVENQDGSFILKRGKFISEPEKRFKGPSIKARYSVCSGHMTNLNIMLDRKLVKELDSKKKCEQTVG